MADKAALKAFLDDMTQTSTVSFGGANLAIWHL